MQRASILTRTWRELRNHLRRWEIGLTFYLFLVVILIFFASEPAVINRLSKIMATFSAHYLFTSFTPTVTQWIIRVNFLFILPFILSVFAVWVGAELMADTDHGGELTLWLAQPVSRWQIVIQKYGVLFLSLLNLTIIAYLLILISDWFLKLNLTLGGLTLACLSNFLTALTYGTLTFLIGVSKRNRKFSIIAGGVMLVFTSLLFLLPVLPPPLRCLSLFTVNANFSPFNKQTSGLPLMILATMNLLLYLAAQVIFESRDLNI